MFPPAPHDDVFAFVIQVAILLIAARGLGEVAIRLRQPAVVGEILAGILLGPSLLGWLIPPLAQFTVPQNETQHYLLENVSFLGATFLLILTGLETDIPLMRRHIRTAALVAAGGLLLPFASGILLGFYLPDSLVAGGSDRRIVFAMFVATSMSVSAIPVIAKVLLDMNLMRRNFGQTIMAAGMIDDAFAWTLLSIVLALAAGQTITPLTVGLAAFKILAFLGISFTLGRWIVGKVLSWVQDRTIVRDQLLTLVVVMAFVWGAIAQGLHIEALLGAFLMGVVFGTMPRLPAAVVHQLETISFAIFAPIFFANAGRKMDFPSLMEPKLALAAAAVLGIACFGKVAGAFIGGKLAGRSNWESLAFGLGMNARGAVEIIIASIGLNLGILTQAMYSIIVLVAVTTSIMAPLLIRLVLHRVQPGDEEQRRLAKEALAQKSTIARVKRVLVPVRWRPAVPVLSIQTIAAHILDRMGTRMSVTLITVPEPEGRERAAAFQDEVAKLFGAHEVSKKILDGQDAVAAILDEAGRDYDLLILGATQSAGNVATVFNPVVDSLVRMAPCPTMIVNGNIASGVWPPRNVLVPSNGSRSSREAADVAFSIVRGTEGEVSILHVVPQPPSSVPTQGTDAAFGRLIGNAYSILNELKALGEANEVNTSTELRTGQDVETVVLEVAKRLESDLIILGTDIRPSAKRLFLGGGVERILLQAPCPVIIVNT